MRIKASVPIAPCLISLMMLSQPLFAGQDKQKAAIKAAETWLSLVDEGFYLRSWREGATYFKNAVSQGQWTQSMVAFRKALGKTLSRKLTSAQYTTTLPGAPDGEYVVIQYQTSFENKLSATETVTPMLDEDGPWKVSGYYIK
ncbi:MAG: DUF4019 domain-containing protein [Deltaproteobacteria bacterium]|nr:MAG: DUF4019 domain-containing protein [Deltaproteobacteria bacterium]